MAELPDRMRPPREEGWLAEDLDSLPDGHAARVRRSRRPQFLAGRERDARGQAGHHHVYELDDVTSTYVPMGVFREILRVDRPFPIEFDVQALYPFAK
ncbi:hypothetical protein [Myceligenerans indicum]|uniref:Uncharacterized protein n=1 Tax=Myceligenerans indicum TaxID=2593663 RepID=A0ABS1LF42_9MICO|nr:hypothetical protein [Myceligenerans indicum]MBL0884694.1 hypothetical protein [Myceligenerans indicum]